jgi:hypothetical protein
VTGRTAEVEALARTIYESASDAADCPWDDLCAIGSDALYRQQASALLPLIAAAEARGAQAVLAAVEGQLRRWGPAFLADRAREDLLTAAHAAAAAAGGGGEA